jgi:hypothetical protein
LVARKSVELVRFFGKNDKDNLAPKCLLSCYKKATLEGVFSRFFDVVEPPLNGGSTVVERPLNGG